MSSHLGEKNRIWLAFASPSIHPAETWWNKPYTCVMLQELQPLRWISCSLVFLTKFQGWKILRRPQSTCLLSKPLAMMADTSVSPSSVPCVWVCVGGGGVVTNPWVANTDWWNGPPHSELQFDFSQIALWETGEKIVLLSNQCSIHYNMFWLVWNF